MTGDIRTRMVERLRNHALNLALPTEVMADCGAAFHRIQELEAALDPFARAAAIADAIPDAAEREADDRPCREWFPGVWPTMGDCRKAGAVLSPSSLGDDK